MRDQHEWDENVRRAVYRGFVAQGRALSRVELAQDLSATAEDVAESFSRLAEGHVLVLDEDGQLWMAMPFSAKHTDDLVSAGNRSWWANCAWDALGISAALRAPVTIESPCPDCEEDLRLEVSGGRMQTHSKPLWGPSPHPVIGGTGQEVVHFAVPARDWWRDIGFT